CVRGCRWKSCRPRCASSPRSRPSRPEPRAACGRAGAIRPTAAMQAQLLSSVLAATSERERAGEHWLERVVREPSITRALSLWIRGAHGEQTPPREEVATLLQRAIAEIDRALS